MCGLFARFHRQASAPPLDSDRFLDLIAHRGPDAAQALGWHTGEERLDGLRHGPPSDLPCIVGHRRLAIIDLADAAAQPFLSADHRFVLAYNGEIYNYVELREQLRSAGLRFQTESDTEVLLRAWEHWGEDCVSRFEGMFAFVLADRKRGTVHVARDPFGIKPLFYAKRDGELFFCSEIGPVLERIGAVPHVPPVLASLLRWGENDGDTNTLYEGVERVAPGTIMRFDLADFRWTETRRYFDLQAIRPEAWSFAEARERLRDTFLATVERHMRSDASLGFALSGGIDSSAILCAAHALGRDDLRSFSFVPDDPRVSERRWIDIVLRHTGARPTFISADPARVQTSLAGVVRAQGEPFGSLSILAQHEVYRRVAEEGVKVILSGQGADELLAGYISFYEAALMEAVSKGRWKRARALFAAMRANFSLGLGGSLRWLARAGMPAPIAEAAGYRHLGSVAAWLNGPALRRAGLPSVVRRGERGNGLQASLIHAVSHTLPGLLRFDDRNSMAYSVESRVPFLTPEMARLCLSMPAEFLISDAGVSKYVFREAMRGIVPDAILDRQDKLGFPPDNRNWLSTLAGFVPAKSPSSPLGDLVDAARLKAVLQDGQVERDGSIDLAWKSLNLLMLEAEVPRP